MSVRDGLLERAQAWISLATREVDDPTTTSEVEVSTAGRTPRSVSWIFDGGDFMAQVVLWDSGEFESDLADVRTGDGQVTSGRIGSVGELGSLLGAARDWVVRGA
jgi:hypothetical protein